MSKSKGFDMKNQSSNRPLPLHNGGGVDFFKIDGNGGSEKFLLENAKRSGRGGGGQNGQGGCLEMWGLPYDIEVFLEIPHDAS